MPRFRSPMYAAMLPLGLAAGSANAGVILDNSGLGRYNNSIGTSLDTSGSLDLFPCANVACGDATVTFATAPNLSAAAGVLGDWLANPAGPGGAWSGVQAIPLNWAINTETAIIYGIDAGAGLANLSLLLGADNGVFVCLDGACVFGARAAGGSSLGEYTLSRSKLSAGTHYLQVLREDHGGAADFDIRRTGDRSRVPEPGTLALTGLALPDALASRRRKG